VDCGVDRFIQPDLQRSQHDLLVKVQRRGRSAIEQLIQPHSIVGPVGFVLALLEPGLSEREFGADEIGLGRLGRGILNLGYVNDLLQVRDIPGVDSGQRFIEQYLVVGSLDAGPQIAERRLIRQACDLGGPPRLIRL
jgi:hypothetical protein